MTRKHFEAIAETIRFLDVTEDDRKMIAEEFARTCKGFNSNFNRERFMHACGVTS